MTGNGLASKLTAEGTDGPDRDDDRRIIHGIVHMLQSGAQWRDCPREYGAYTTICHRFNRWVQRGRWGRNL
jgi:transposase